jgi:hypothetical protein
VAGVATTARPIPGDSDSKCPEGGQLFVWVRTQIYCKKLRLNKAKIRARRHIETGKAYEKPRSRARDEQQVKQRNGNYTSRWAVGKAQERSAKWPG